jgi:hypothetical protein
MGISEGESHAGTGVLVVETGVLQMQVGTARSTGEVVTAERVRPSSGEPVFAAAGREANGEYRCAACGYGVIVRSVLPACPMCRGLVWEEPSGSPFSS